MSMPVTKMVRLLLLLTLFVVPVQAEEMLTYLLVMKDGKLLPERLEVASGVRFRLEVRNEGSGAAEFESLELKKESVLAPGATRRLVFFPLKPGEYRFFDEFHPDTAQGLIIAK